MPGCWGCVCGKVNLTRDDKCVRCGGDRGIAREREEPIPVEQRGKYGNAIERLYVKMLREGTTPYGPDCVFTRAQISLGMASAILRQKGHEGMADHMDAEIKRIQSIPDLDTDIANYTIGTIWQGDLMREMYEFAKERGLVDDVYPYMNLHADRVRRISN